MPWVDYPRVGDLVRVKMENDVGFCHYIEAFIIDVKFGVDGYHDHVTVFYEGCQFMCDPNIVRIVSRYEDAE